MPTRYETTTKAQLESDSDVFLDEWGETITRRIAGSAADTETILAVFITDAEIPGDLVGDDENGRRVIREAEFEVKASQAVLLTDVFERTNGELWSVVETPARDGGMKTVICRSSSGGTSKRARIRP